MKYNYIKIFIQKFKFRFVLLLRIQRQGCPYGYKKTSKTLQRMEKIPIEVIELNDCYKKIMHNRMSALI